MSNLISKPTKAYLERAAIPSVKLNKAQKQQQLLILDLNGTLVSRNRKNRSMYVRPYSKQFFEYIFENFYVMLWSSAQPHSVRNMCRLFGANQEKIKVIWDRTKFGLTQKDYNRKVATIKDLDKVWKYFDEQHPEQHFDQTNTILLDDSPKKAQLQPYNCVHPSEFEHTSPTFISSGDSELLHIMNYLKLLQFQSNVSNFIREQPYNTLENDKSNNVYEVIYFSFDGELGKAVDLRPRRRPKSEGQRKEIKKAQDKRIDEKLEEEEDALVAKMASIKFVSQ